MKTIIGILPSYTCEDENPYSEYYKYSCIFARKILSSNAVPVGVMFDGEKVNYDALEIYDGFLITGGNKINRYILEILYYAYKHKIPVLGICMGAEAIDIFSMILDYIDENKTVNLETLEKYYYEIKEKYGAVLRRLEPGNIHNNHIIDGNIEKTKHEIEILPNTIASEIFGKKELVPSMHNYDFYDVGKHFLISGKALDGVSEIIECTDKNQFILGLHFHPELIDSEVFTYFIEKCKENKKI